MKTLSRKNSTFTLLFLAVAMLFNTACSEVGFTEITKAASKVVGNDEGETLFANNFTQKAENTPVDIIVVVDDSPSMSSEQKKLGERIESFIASLNGVDWRIAITTTDVSDDGPQGDFVTFEGTTTNVLSETVTNYKDVFLNTVKRKASKSSSERPLEATILALSKANTVNKGFFREQASLSIIYISDEDERSNGGSKATKPSEVVAAVTSLSSKKDFTAYGIIVEPGDSKCLFKAGNHKEATHVSALAYATGGLTGSICADDYSPTLKAIGKNVRKLNDTFELLDLPDNDSVEVSLAPEQDIKWSLEGKKLIFDVPPLDDTKITVKFKKPKSK